MAIKLENKTNVDPPSVDFPYANIKDDTGVGDGTPVDVQVYGDFHQFFARLAALAGITFNNLPDNLTNGFQYIDALLAVANRQYAHVTIAGSLDGSTVTFDKNNIYTYGAGATTGAVTFSLDFTDAKFGAEAILIVGLSSCSSIAIDASPTHYEVMPNPLTAMNTAHLSCYIRLKYVGNVGGVPAVTYERYSLT